MRFLENLVSDLVRDATGVNPKRLIRMAGGKNILMMGAGAAIAGALGQAGQQKQNTPAGAIPVPATPAAAAPPPPLPTASPAAAPPPIPGSPAVGSAAPGNVTAPPPPVPGAAAPPPIPPTIPASADPASADPTPADPETQSADDEVSPTLAFAIVRTLVAASLADGHLAPEEKTIIENNLGQSGLDNEKTAQIHRDLVLPPSPSDLSGMVSDLEERKTLYRFAALVILADGEMSDLEQGWLRRLAEALLIGDDLKATLEAEVFDAE